MERVKLAALALAGAIGLSACMDAGTPTIPAQAEVSAPSLNAVPAAGRTQLVVFKGNRPAGGFAEHVEALGGTVVATFDAVGAAAVRGLSPAASAQLKAIPGVAFVEAEPQFSLAEPVTRTAPVAMGASPASPGDPARAGLFAWQWNMQAIGAPAAWAAGHLGSPDVTVAILDTGIDYLHLDTEGRVDLDRSASFVGDDYISGPNGEDLDTDDDYVAFFFPDRHPITDIGFHGTHVAATVSSNAYASAGVTSKVTLIGAKVCSVALGYCPGVSVFAGLYHALEQGADVVNMSLGGGFQKKAYPGYVSLLNRLFNELHRNGVTVVVAAGNDSNDLDHNLIWNGGAGQYEHSPSWFATYCDMPNVICVSATGPTASPDPAGPWEEIDAPAVYTNFGRSAITVAAPGGNMGGHIWAACSTSSLEIPDCQAGSFIVGAAGTSMAAPHTAGLAALIVERVGRKPSQVKARLTKHADDLGQRGTDPFYGRGRINVARTLGVD